MNTTFLQKLERVKLLYPKYVRGMVDWRTPKGLARSIRTLLFVGKNLSKLQEGHIRFVAKLSSVKENCVESYLWKLNNDTTFFKALERRYMQAWPNARFYPHYFETKYPSPGGSIFFQAVTMYLLVGAVQPRIVVETGGGMGKSTAFILKALEDNQEGKLITLDTHPETIEGEFLWWPEGQPSCFLVPDYLKHRLELRLGDARQTLPELLEELDTVDLFRHDSDHSYEHMTFEFRTAWPALYRGSILVSDDIRANQAFFEFCQQVDRIPIVSLGHLGGIKKIEYCVVLQPLHLKRFET